MDSSGRSFPIVSAAKTHALASCLQTPHSCKPPSVHQALAPALAVLRVRVGCLHPRRDKWPRQYPPLLACQYQGTFAHSKVRQPTETQLHHRQHRCAGLGGVIAAPPQSWW